MAFARMNDQHAGTARRVEHVPARPDRRLQPGHVVAERGAEAARLQKIALHIDDEQGRLPEIDRQRRRLRLDGRDCR